MTVRTSERRLCTRVAAAYPVVLTDERGRLVGRGRTANISEGGVLVILRCNRAQHEQAVLIAELTIPGMRDIDTRSAGTRQVRYRCRVVRQQRMGSLSGLGLEFLQKM